MKTWYWIALGVALLILSRRHPAAATIRSWINLDPQPSGTPVSRQNLARLA